MKVISKWSIAINLFLLIVVAGLFTIQPAMAQRGDDSKRKSKNGKTEGTIDSVDIVIEYGRPKVNDREIWGGLVPYNKVWRTGADEATTISFGKDVLIEGQKLAAGKYGLFTIPGKEKWTIIFNKVPEQWGAFKYDESQDALRVEVKPETNEMVEEMTFTISPPNVVLEWEKLKVPFKVAAASEPESQ
jgi:hypothetical protein